MRPHLSLLVFILLSLFLTSCAPDKNAVTPLPAASQVPSLTPSITYTNIPTESPRPTGTQITCKLLESDFCVLSGTFVLQRPIGLPDTMTIDRGYPYGSTAGGTRIPHHGVEFYNGTGTPVLAAAEGNVYFVGDDSAALFSNELDYYGNLIILQHRLEGKIIFTLYAHLSKMVVEPGQTVLGGQKIAEVGATGAAIGSHLHFEVRLHPEDVTSTLNPELWLQPASGAGVLSIRYTNTLGDFIRVQSNIQNYHDRETMPVQAWQPETYAPEISMGNNWENMLLGDLPGGLYRISFLWEGVLHERWVDVQPGKLTITSFELP